MTRGKKKDELSLEEKLEQALVPVEEQPYEVPENWCWTTIESISDIVSKGTTPKGGKSSYVEDGIRFLRVENFLDDGTISHEGMMHIAEDIHFGFLKRSILEKDDVLISIAGTLGKTAIVQEDNLPINTNQAVAFIRLNSKAKILPKYLRFALINPVIQNYLLEKTKVTSIPNLTLEIISSCPIPLPPKEEQQRIVDQIESLFAKLDEVKEKAKEVIDIIDDNVETVLYKAFTGHLTNGWRNLNPKIEKWNDTTLSDIVSGLKYGSSEKSDYEYKGTPVLRIPNIGDGIVDFSDIKYMSGELKNPSHEVLENDILIIRSNGSRDLVGKCAIVPELKQRYAYASFLIRMKASEKVLPEYLVRFMNSSMARVQMFAKVKSSSGIHNINSKELGAIKICIPSIEEQRQILTIIREFVDKEKKAREIAEEVIDNIDRLKKNILSKAFRGKLGTNNSHDESAIDLLKAVITEY